MRFWQTLEFHRIKLEKAERGFSFKKDAPLDMRMNQKGEITAEGIVNSYSEKNLLIFLKIWEKKNFPKNS